MLAKIQEDAAANAERIAEEHGEDGGDGGHPVTQSPDFLIDGQIFGGGEGSGGGLDEAEAAFADGEFSPFGL